MKIELEIGLDIGELLGITKHIPPVVQDLDAKGNLPFGIFKTDESNWQRVDFIPYGEIVDVSLKIDGSSMSVAYKNGQTAICSRSLELKPEYDNNYTKIAKKFSLLEKLTAYCQKHNVNLCLRGEIHGQGIQNFKHNPHSKGELSFALFSVLNLDTLKYENKGSSHYFLNVAKELDIPAVPVLESDVVLTKELVKRYDEELEKINGQPFEGCVVKGKDFSFKIINKHFDSLK